jgi:hypothetical protein
MTPKSRRRVALFILAAMTAGATLPLNAEEARKPDVHRSLGPLEKSFLVPGWGQISEKKYWEGVAFFAAEALCVWGILANNHRGNESYAAYRNAQSVDEAVQARRLTETYDGRRNKLLLAAAAVWVANLVDISLIVKHRENRTMSLSFRVTSTHEGLGVSASCRY